MKKCTSCEEFLDESLFQKRAASNDGLTASCKSCLSQRDKKRETEERKEARRIYQKTENGKSAHAKAAKKYNETYPLKRAAHIIIGNAIRDKAISKSESCSICSSTTKIEAHHDDYTKPMHVRWLCEKCHKDWHKNNKPKYR